MLVIECMQTLQLFLWNNCICAFKKNRLVCDCLQEPSCHVPWNLCLQSVVTGTSTHVLPFLFVAKPETCRLTRFLCSSPCGTRPSHALIHNEIFITLEVTVLAARSPPSGRSVSNLRQLVYFAGSNEVCPSFSSA